MRRRGNVELGENESDAFLDDDSMEHTVSELKRKNKQWNRFFSECPCVLVCTFTCQL